MTWLGQHYHLAAKPVNNEVELDTSTFHVACSSLPVVIPVGPCADHVAATQVTETGVTLTHYRGHEHAQNWEPECVVVYDDAHPNTVLGRLEAQEIALRAKADATHLETAVEALRLQIAGIEHRFYVNLLPLLAFVVGALALILTGAQVVGGRGGPLSGTLTLHESLQLFFQGLAMMAPVFIGVLSLVLGAWAIVFWRVSRGEQKTPGQAGHGDGRRS